MVRHGSSDNSGRPGRPEDEPTEVMDYAGSYDPATTPTRYAGALDPTDPLESPDPAGPENPTPWFRRRPVLIAWITLIVLMIALVIWGIIQLTSRGPGDTTVPTVPTAPETTSSTTPTTAAASTTTTTTSGSTAIRPTPPSAAPPPARSPAGGPPSAPPRHRHHLPPLPSVITIPPIPKAPEIPTVITLPPHL